MSANLLAIFYLISGVLFILALRGLSSPETSRQGNLFGIIGMTIAIGVTIISVGNFSLGFIYLYLMDLRKTGLEVFNRKIWWNDLRPIHGVLYLLFFMYSIKKKQYSWIILLIDVIIGLTSFLYFNYVSNGFKYLI